MLKLSEQDAQTLRAAIALARAHPLLLSAVRSLYADVQHEIDLRKPRCDASGRCCNFEKFGHRLFVTTLELAAFLDELAAHPESSTDPSPIRHLALDIRHSPTCPFQLDRLCSVHTIRPFGCRIFFCDPTATDWQHDQYETFHLRLRQLHTDLNVPYLYVEWREGLRAVAKPQ